MFTTAPVKIVPSINFNAREINRELLIHNISAHKECAEDIVDDLIESGRLVMLNYVLYR